MNNFVGRTNVCDSKRRKPTCCIIHRLKRLVGTVVALVGPKKRSFRVPITVLVVEDDESIRNMWVAYLKDTLPVTVIQAGSVSDALPLLDASDILILDWFLGDATGESVLGYWMAYAGGPVCLCSGQLTYAELADFVNVGVYDVLPKPFLLKDLGSIVRGYVAYIHECMFISEVYRETRFLRLGVAYTSALVLVVLILRILRVI